MLTIKNRIDFEYFKNLRYVYLFLLFSTMFVGCGYFSAGTLGGFPPVTFPTTKKDLEIAIDSFYKDHPEYNIPQKWKDRDTWHERGYDFLESRIFYFSNDPEEMYYVTFIGDDTMNKTSTATIAIRAVDSNSHHWTTYDEMDDSERKKIEKRFNDEIISRLEKYTGTVSHIGYK